METGTIINQYKITLQGFVQTDESGGMDLKENDREFLRNAFDSCCQTDPPNIFASPALVQAFRRKRTYWLIKQIIAESDKHSIHNVRRIQRRAGSICGVLR